MSELTADKIVQRAVELNLLEQGQLHDVFTELGRRNVSSEDLVRVCLRRELLTNYQVERLLKGESGGFFYGVYKVLYLVGAGTFSRVYRAEHVDTGELAAVKVLRRRHSDDPRITDQFFREGDMGRRLRHPNIVPIFEVYSKGLTHYLAMEFVEGRNMREFIKTRKKLEPTEAVRIVADICSGMSYAFKQGVSHRDLKMTNVLISSLGVPKVVDFGLASERGGGDEEHINPRTIDYAGLERATGVRKDDSRSDIFFLGCMLYHLLAGKAPLAETKDRIQRLSRSRYLEVVPINRLEPELPAPVVAVVGRAMETNPERRYQTPADMLSDLRGAAHRLDPHHKATEEPDVDADLGPLPSVGLQKVVMVVESNASVQDALRAGLKRVGYKVLMISDPDRALERFRRDGKTADCVVFSAGELGARAVDAFNRFGDDDETRKKPAVLLLGSAQTAFKSAAQLNDHRVIVEMPIKLREFRIALATLMPPKPAPAAPAAESA